MEVKSIPKLNEIITDWDEFHKKDNQEMTTIGKFVFVICKGIQFKCVSCGNCCITNQTPIMKVDIKQINQFLGKNPKLKFLKDKWLVKGEITEKSHTGFYIKKVSIPNKNIGGKIFSEKCIFLKKLSQSKYICKIHSVKPLICLRYPFEYLIPLIQNDPAHFYIGINIESSGLSEGERSYHRLKNEETFDYVCNGFHLGKQNKKNLIKIANVFKRTNDILSKDIYGVEMSEDLTNLSDTEIMNKMYAHFEKLYGKDLAVVKLFETMFTRKLSELKSKKEGE